MSETFEEWKKSLNLKYTFGLNRSDGASRRYTDFKNGVGAECHTSRNEETGKWGKSEWLYYLERSGKSHETLEGVYEEAKSLEEKEGER